MIDLATDPLPGNQLHAYLARQRETAPLTETRLIDSPARLLTRFNDVRTFLADLDTFPAGSTYEMLVQPTVGRTFISMDGDDHDAYRMLAMPAFRSRPATRFVESALVPLAHEVIDRFAARGEVDLVAEFTRVLPFWAISRKVGLPEGTEEQQRAWALALLSYPVDPDRALAASQEVTRFLAPVIEERRNHATDDVLSHLLQEEIGGLRMSDEEVFSHIRLLYAVGATTSSDAMSSLFYTLLTSPDVFDRAVHDPPARPWIVNELLRFEPPVANLPRLAPRGGVVGGVEVDAGTLVMASIASANRDPRVFDDPDRFDPDRRQRDLVTFGAGAKFCPGSHLANRQLVAALDVVCERLPGLELVEAAEPTGAILRSCKRLVVRWRTGI
jgi:cytochrome P450